MTDPEKHALAMELKTPRGRVLLTYLKELATDFAMSAMRVTDRDEVFALVQRGSGLMEAHKQLETIANDPNTGAYVTTES